MLSPRSLKFSIFLAAAVAGPGGGQPDPANAADPVARFTAFAVNLGGPGAGRSGTPQSNSPSIAGQPPASATV